MSTKKCTVCKDTKIVSEFNKNKTTSDGLNNICRVCSNAQSKRYYIENKEKHLESVKVRRDNNRLENRQKLFNFYKNNPCIDCGESDPIVLELDHKDDVEKKGNVSEMMEYSWTTIEIELSKCDVRCANCHRRRTAIQQGWYKNVL